MIRVFYGKDEFSIHERIKEIRLTAFSSELGDINTAFLDGKDLSRQELISTASTVPFMSENRLVIVDNLAKKFEFGRGAPKPKLGDWEGIVLNGLTRLDNVVVEYAKVGVTVNHKSVRIHNGFFRRNVKECDGLKETIWRK